MMDTNDRIPQDRADYRSTSGWGGKGSKDEEVDIGEESYRKAEVMSSNGGGFPSAANSNQGGIKGGDFTMRPIFLGNISYEANPEDILETFQHPYVPYAPEGSDLDPNAPIAVDHVDLKRGFAFVFLKDVFSEAEKVRIEHYVSDLNGLNIPKVSNALRSEFARGDGRVKRKEDMRRAMIAPSETLFVVNFHEDTTKREDLQMLFEPFGKLLRIDMKKNYAFVQFESVEQATRAKEATDGGKLDQSKITVEYVARKVDRRGESGGPYRGPPSRDEFSSRGGGRGGGFSDSRGGDRYGDRYSSSGGRGGRDGPYGGSSSRIRDRSPPPISRGHQGGSRARSPPSRDRYYDDRAPRGRSPDAGKGRYSRYDSPGRFPPRGARSPDRYGSYDGGRREASRGGRDRSRSRSPEYRSGGRGRSRSPPRGRDHDYDYSRRDSRGRSPDYAPRRDVYREDRGYSRD